MKRTLDNSKDIISQPEGGQENSTSAKGIIFDIKRYAIHDGPGIRTTVFLKGCPLKCGWCHNPESRLEVPERSFNIQKCTGCGACVEQCPEGAITIINGKAVTDAAKCRLCGKCVKTCPAGARNIIGWETNVDEVISEIEKDTVFYDQSGGGATFSGGEPLMQPEFLGGLLERCKEHGMNTVVDTSCYAERKVLEKISENTDIFLCDFKCANSKKHKAYTGVGNELIIENIRYLASTDNEVIIRLVIIPGFNDDSKNIEDTKRFVASLDSVEKIDILPYNKSGVKKAKGLEGKFDIMEVKEAGTEQMDRIADEFKRCGFKVTIGG